MKELEKTNPPRPHLEIQETATESQVVISRGEEILNRIHKLAQEIEAQVQHALHTPPSQPGNPSRPSRR
jgi:hypothetical protein